MRVRVLYDRTELVDNVIPHHEAQPAGGRALLVIAVLVRSWATCAPADCGAGHPARCSSRATSCCGPKHTRPFRSLGAIDFSLIVDSSVIMVGASTGWRCASMVQKSRWPRRTQKQH